MNGCTGNNTTGPESQDVLELSGQIYLSTYTDDDGFQLYRLTFNGIEIVEFTQLTNKDMVTLSGNDIFDAFYPDVSSDGRYVVFNSTIAGFDMFTIWIYDTSANTVSHYIDSELEFPKWGNFPRWHPTKRKIAFNDFGGINPLSFDYETLETVNLKNFFGDFGSGFYPFYYNPIWNPDGSILTSISNYESVQDTSLSGFYLYAVTLSDNQFKRLATVPSMSSPDNKTVWLNENELIIRDSDGLYTVSIHTGTKRPLLLDINDYRYQAQAASDDGRYLLVIRSTPSTLQIFDVEKNISHDLMEISIRGAGWILD